MTLVFAGGMLIEVVALAVFAVLAVLALLGVVRWQLVLSLAAAGALLVLVTTGMALVAVAIRQPQPIVNSKNAAPPARLVKDPVSVEAAKEKSAEPPAWVSEGPHQLDGTYFEHLEAGPFASREECLQALGPRLEKSVAEFVELHLNSAPGQSVTLDRSELWELVRQVWYEPVDSSVGPMLTLHAQLGLDRKAQARLAQRWRQAESSTRMQIAWLVGSGLLTVLASIYVYLWLDRRAVLASSPTHS